MSSNNQESGYSLIEFMVAAGLSVVVLMISLEVSVNQKKTFNELEDKVSTHIESDRIGAKIARIIESVGGQGLLPSLALDLENNCAARWIFPDCQNSDRLTMLLPELLNGALYPTYIAIGYTSATGDIAVTVTPPGCSLNSLLNKTVVLFLETGEVMTRRITNIDNATCVLSSVADRQSTRITNTLTNPFLGAKINVVKPITFYYDRTQKIIFRFTDNNNDDTLDPDEVTALFGDIFEFQFGLGYDFTPKDNAVSDSSNSSDEWLYNASGEDWNLGVFVLPARRSDLLMMQVQLAVGVPTKGVPSSTMTLLDGPLLTPGAFVIRHIRKNIVFRNLMTY